MVLGWVAASAWGVGCTLPSQCNSNDDCPVNSSCDMEAGQCVSGAGGGSSSSGGGGSSSSSGGSSGAVASSSAETTESSSLAQSGSAPGSSATGATSGSATSATSTGTASSGRSSSSATLASGSSLVAPSSSVIVPSSSSGVPPPSSLAVPSSSSSEPWSSSLGVPPSSSLTGPGSSSRPPSSSGSQIPAGVVVTLRGENPANVVAGQTLMLLLVVENNGSAVLNYTPGSPLLVVKRVGDDYDVSSNFSGLSGAAGAIPVGERREFRVPVTALASMDPSLAGTQVRPWARVTLTAATTASVEVSGPTWNMVTRPVAQLGTPPAQDVSGTGCTRICFKLVQPQSLPLDVAISVTGEKILRIHEGPDDVLGTPAVTQGLTRLSASAGGENHCFLWNRRVDLADASPNAATTPGNTISVTLGITPLLNGVAGTVVNTTYAGQLGAFTCGLDVRAPRSFPTPRPSGVSASTHVDLDLDGRPDLVVLQHPGPAPAVDDLYWQRGIGAGGLGTITGLANGPVPTILAGRDVNKPASLRVARVLGGAVPDLILASGRPAVAQHDLHVLPRQGNPPVLLAPSVKSVTLDGESLESVTVVDANHDGREELVVLLKDLQGRPLLRLVGADATGSLTNNPLPAPGAAAYALGGGVGDLNGDGFPDAVTLWTDAASSGQELWILWGSTSGLGTSPTVLTPAQRPFIQDLLGLVVGDVTGDGVADLVVIQRGSGQTLYELALYNWTASTTPGTLEMAGTTRSIASMAATSPLLMLGRFTGLSTPDALVYYPVMPEPAYLFDHSDLANPTAGQPVNFPQFVWNPVAADVDHDGRDDLMGLTAGGATANQPAVIRTRNFTGFETVDAPVTSAASPPQLLAHGVGTYMAQPMRWLATVNTQAPGLITVYPAPAHALQPFSLQLDAGVVVTALASTGGPELLVATSENSTHWLQPYSVALEQSSLTSQGAGQTTTKPVRSMLVTELDGNQGADVALQFADLTMAWAPLNGALSASVGPPSRNSTGFAAGRAQSQARLVTTLEGVASNGPELFYSNGSTLVPLSTGAAATATTRLPAFSVDRLVYVREDPMEDALVLRSPPTGPFDTVLTRPLGYKAAALTTAPAALQGRELFVLAADLTGGDHVDLWERAPAAANELPPLRAFQVPGVPLHPAAGAAGLQVADFNGDGAPDILVISPSETTGSGEQFSIRIIQGR